MTGGPIDDYEQRLRQGAVRYFVHRHKKKLVALFGLGSLVWVGSCGSTWMIERADKSDTACYQRDFEGSPGASEDCAGWARALMRLLTVRGSCPGKSTIDRLPR